MARCKSVGENFWAPVDAERLPFPSGVGATGRRHRSEDCGREKERLSLSSSSYWPGKLKQFRFHSRRVRSISSFRGKGRLFPGTDSFGSLRPALPRRDSFPGGSGRVSLTKRCSRLEPLRKRYFTEGSERRFRKIVVKTWPGKSVYPLKNSILLD